MKNGRGEGIFLPIEGRYGAIHEFLEILLRSESTHDTEEKFFEAARFSTSWQQSRCSSRTRRAISYSTAVFGSHQRLPQEFFPKCEAREEGFGTRPTCRPRERTAPCASRFHEREPLIVKRRTQFETDISEKEW
jgi:hypothetical protein